jgi:hydrogenase-4 component E
MSHTSVFLLNVIDFLLSFTMLLSVLMLGVRRLKTRIILLGTQSLMLVLMLTSVGLLHHSHHALWVALFTLLGKCMMIPAVLFWVVHKVPMRKQLEAFLTPPTAMLIGGSLVLLAHYLTNILFQHEAHLFIGVFSVGVSLVFIGLMIMMNFKKAITQIIGLYVLDNGIFCLTLATVFEMPLIIEMGILFELLLGVLVLSALVSRIKVYFDTVNIDELQALRG